MMSLATSGGSFGASLPTAPSLALPKGVGVINKTGKGLPSIPALEQGLNRFLSVEVLQAMASTFSYLLNVTPT